MKTEYKPLDALAKKEHGRQFKDTKFKDKLIAEWEKNTGQQWPTYRGIVNGEEKAFRYQAHHMNPQQLGGKHEWWNMHPVHPTAHQGGIHGRAGMLNKIIKGLSKE
jgi:hypothetical protein